MWSRLENLNRALSWLWSCLVVPLAVCSCHENLNWVWICGKSLVKAWIKHIVVAKTIIMHEVVAKASIFIILSHEKNYPTLWAGEKNTLTCSDINRKKIPVQTKIPPQNIKWTVPYTSGLKCSYSLVNYFLRNFEHIFMKPQINLVQKWTGTQYHFSSWNPVKLNIIPYVENTKIPFLKLLK